MMTAGNINHQSGLTDVASLAKPSSEPTKTRSNKQAGHRRCRSTPNSDRYWSLSHVDHIGFERIEGGSRTIVETSPWYFGIDDGPFLTTRLNKLTTREARSDTEFDEGDDEPQLKLVIIENLDMVKPCKRSLKTQYTMNLKGRRPRPPRRQARIRRHLKLKQEQASGANASTAAGSSIQTPKHQNLTMEAQSLVAYSVDNGNNDPQSAQDRQHDQVRGERDSDDEDEDDGANGSIQSSLDLSYVSSSFDQTSMYSFGTLSTSSSHRELLLKKKEQIDIELANIEILQKAKQRREAQDGEDFGSVGLGSTGTNSVFSFARASTWKNAKGNKLISRLEEYHQGHGGDTPSQTKSKAERNLKAITNDRPRKERSIYDRRPVLAPERSPSTRTAKNSVTSVSSLQSISGRSMDYHSCSDEDDGMERQGKQHSSRSVARVQDDEQNEEVETIRVRRKPIAVHLEHTQTKRHGTYTGYITVDSKLPHCPDSNPGAGLLTFANGDVYEGPFVFGKMQGGDATYRWVEGDMYIGEFARNMRHGKGTQVTTRNRKYVGFYEYDVPHGYGILYDRDGSIHYMGNWSNGRPNRSGPR